MSLLAASAASINSKDDPRQALASTVSAATAKALPAKSQQQEAVEKPPSILQMLDGHETELLVAAVIALAFFMIGWICGGHYYLKRDQRRRTRLRF